MQLSVDVDLSLGDVTSEIRDGMGDVIVGHGEDGDLSDGAVTSLHSAGTLCVCVCVCVWGGGNSTGFSCIA